MMRQRLVAASGDLQVATLPLLPEQASTVTVASSHITIAHRQKIESVVTGQAENKTKNSTRRVVEEYLRKSK